MSHSPLTEYRDVTVSVPVHLIDAFHLNVDEFFELSDAGHSVGQRAAEVRADDHDQGLDSLAILVSLAEADTGQSPVVAQFLASLYAEGALQAKPTDLRQLDADLFEHCLAVLRLVYMVRSDLYRYVGDGRERWARLVATWNESQRLSPDVALLDEHRYAARYEGHRHVPGLQAVQLEVVFGPTHERLELHFPATDSARLANDLVGVHTRAWHLRPGSRPLDAAQETTRPWWVPL